MLLMLLDPFKQKGGRQSVHGWLFLPLDQETPTDPLEPVIGWFSHHTPEFWIDSPHNFQIIFLGNMVPMLTVNNVTEVIPLPYPPQADLLVDEFSFTPPGDFSLNDFLTGDINTLYGVVYNGSFDTLYERIPISIATVTVETLTYQCYLNISATDSYPYLRYYSFPRTTNTSSEEFHVYLAHEIHTAPDFDQIVHAVVNTKDCVCSGCRKGYLPIYGVSVWEFPNIKNNLENRLMPNSTLVAAVNLGSEKAVCKMQVLEEIHCVVGPAFADRC